METVVVGGEETRKLLFFEYCLPTLSSQKTFSLHLLEARAAGGVVNLIFLHFLIQYIRRPEEERKKNTRTLYTASAGDVLDLRRPSLTIN